MLSMTGYANDNLLLTAPDGSKINVSMSLKTVNSRFFEVTSKLPYALSHMETTFIQLLKPDLFRGKIYLTIHMHGSQAFQAEITPALSTVKEYKKAINAIIKECDIPGSITLEHIVRLPNIFNVEEKELDPAYAQQIIAALEELIKRVNQARAQEGDALKKDLLERLAIMRTKIDEITQSFTLVIEEQKKKVNQAITDLEGDENAFAQARKDALYTLLDKMDIHEEIVRFNSHLENFKKQVNSADMEKGKRLDFTLQELAREINTIAAKCSDATIGSLAIDVKVEVEKAREQVQNIV